MPTVVHPHLLNPIAFEAPANVSQKFYLVAEFPKALHFPRRIVLCLVKLLSEILGKFCLLANFSLVVVEVILQSFRMVRGLLVEFPEESLQ